MVTNDTKPVSDKPKTFNEAWDQANEYSCKKWQEAICKEFTDMNKQQVWCMTHKSLMSPDCRCVKNGSSRSSAMVCTGCILWDVDTAKYWCKFLPKLLFSS